MAAGTGSRSSSGRQDWRRFRAVALGAMAGLVALGLLALVPATASASASARVPATHPVSPPSRAHVVPGAGWQPVLSGESASAVSCPTAAVCYTTGSANGEVSVLKSIDGAASWQVLSVPAEGGSGLSISCFSTTQCVVIAGESYNIYGNAVGNIGIGSNTPAIALVTANGGTTWTVPALPGDFAAGIVDCPTSTACFAGGVDMNGTGEVVASTDGGASWAAQALPGSAGALSDISCFSALDCTAVGPNTLLGTTDGGTAWTLEALPPLVEGIESVSCPSSTSCLAVGFDVVIRTTDSGTTWTLTPPPPNFQELTTLACFSTSACVVGAYDALWTTPDLGTTWVVSTVLPSSPISQFVITSLSCPVTTTTCVGVSLSQGADVLTSSDSGASFAVRPLSGTAETLSALACPSASVCFAVGASSRTQTGAVLSSTDGGVTWTAQSVPGNVRNLGGLACPSTTTCIAVGHTQPGASVIIATANGGTTWTLQQSPTGANDLSAITCLTGTTCLAVGRSSASAEVIRTTNGGAAWSAVTIPAGEDPLSGVACATATLCFADGGRSVIESHTGGTSWTAAAVPPVENLRGLACPTASRCILAAETLGGGGGGSGAVLVTNNGGGSFTAVTDLPGTSLWTVACLTATSCRTVGEQAQVATGILASTDGGTTWGVQRAPAAGSAGGPGTYAAMSCVSSSTCVVVGENQSQSCFYGSQIIVYPGSCPGSSILETSDGGGPIGAVGTGYWLAASDGGIFAFGSAGYFGSMGGIPLNKPMVGMATTADRAGYWLVASDGGIFAFGDAGFHGSMGGSPLNRPIVGMAVTPDGGGYWMVASDGGIFAFGDAAFAGSMGGVPLAKPVVGMAVDPATGGYWMVASDGGLFAFNAPFYGSIAGVLGNGTVGLEDYGPGLGYRIADGAGLVSSFGAAPDYGNVFGAALGGSIVGITG